MGAEPLITWPQPILEYLGFVAAFLTVGAIAFRFVVLRPWRKSCPADETATLTAIERRAALLGLIGALLSAVLAWRQIAEVAARKHLSLGEVVAANPMTEVQIAAIAAAIVGFALASAKVGWLLAGAGVLAGFLRSGFFGQWSRMVNPLHELAAGSWIGTLALMTLVGLPGALRAPFASERRAGITAAMVAAFSPWALSSAALLGISGVITAWRHLHVLSNLWSTPYGYALITKLCVVAGVLALGAWNWRRQRPRMGTEAGAHALKRSALAELCLAALVLAVTAVLVSLPSPKAPGAG